MLIALVFLLPLAITLCLASDYQERLHLRPLPNSALLASFNFRSNTSALSFDQQNFRYFPRSLGQILQHTSTKELHLRFSLGRWDSESWGARPWDGAREGGTGVELWAWVEADTADEAETRWLGLTNALSGLFCASLNFIDSTKTIRPIMTFEPEGIFPNSSLSNLHLLHGTLPHEVVCTENLTPFLKLLPCKGKAGISSLFDGHKLFDATWQTMAIDVRPICDEGGKNCVLQVEQTVDMVLDIARSLRSRRDPIPRPVPIEEVECDTSKLYSGEDSCFPIKSSSEPSWSLKDIFGKPINGSCPLETGPSSSIYPVCLTVPLERTVMVQTEKPFHESKEDNGLTRCYSMPEAAEFDLLLPAENLVTEVPLPSPQLHASRHITGYGSERGGMWSTIVNPSANLSVSIVYLESLPWFMRPYLHTLRVTAESNDQQDVRHDSDPLESTYYRPAVDRARGTHLELVLTIPPASTVTISYDFEKAVLRYTEYPPDANRGFDVAPAVIRVLPQSPRRSTSDEAQSRGIYLRTTSLLLQLPTPDFSMPYNVIILTSTVMALGFGGIFNLVVRRFVGADEAPPAGLAAIVALLQQRIKGRLAFLVSQLKGGTKQE
ncbi:GPI transamidase-like protein component Gpi16 [Eremomyces bilateralis CBS 781.70]|uniref:GPI transamidase-like protein component Gpi16 n=1 Tax=Eremomyces bilateralis CBS 781.70 TaxID=1392243 RepID=A0A6G1FQA7_9PEZI|nr:GPI transamidase-like protein component Gpi16 [Eremomyces bilateralis CBS 781.70]KAF1807977.1 GPI transamidase-like protein component Gpi16 [Eremomyces bilateralis CBS 781.70]